MNVTPFVSTELKPITAAREYLATEPAGERAELIARQRGVQENGINAEMRELAKATADMLEADARQANRVPMTDDEIDEIGVDYHGNFQVLRNFARAIESHLSTK